MRNVLLALIVLLSSGAAFAQDCAAPLKPMLRAEMYFGRNVRFGAPVSEGQWTRFVARELMPRFPGLTILDAQGAWRENEREVREKTKLVIVALPDTAANREQIAAAAEAYKKRFRQTSVGIMTQLVCASF
jgi:hypothetical protein